MEAKRLAVLAHEEVDRHPADNREWRGEVVRDVRAHRVGVLLAPRQQAEDYALPPSAGG